MGRLFLTLTSVMLEKRDFLLLIITAKEDFHHSNIPSFHYSICGAEIQVPINTSKSNNLCKFRDVMTAFYAFFIRLALSLVLGFLICRFFFPGASPIKVMGFAAIMLVLSYLFENARKKES
jgi:hypothetical protein